MNAGTPPILRPRAAMTLVEVLAVLGIIGVLFALLLPAVGAVRAHARLLHCSTNLRTLGTAAAQYACDYSNWLPRDAYSDSDAFFAPHFAAALGRSQPDTTIVTVGGKRGPRVQVDLAYCMEWLRSAPEFKCPAVTDDVHVLHYAINSMDFDAYGIYGIYKERPWQKVTSARNTASTALLVEANMTTTPATSIGQYNINKPTDLPYYQSPSAFAGTPTPVPRMISASDRRHRGRTTVLFFDGHVEVRNLSSAGDWKLSVLNPYLP